MTRGTDGKPRTSIEPVDQGRDIQTIFVDMWLKDHAASIVAGKQGEAVQVATAKSS
jgi:hypothetical protein